MLRRCFTAALVLFVLGGFVLAESVRGIITSVSDKEVKITVRKKGEKKGEERTFKVTGDTKFVKRVGKDKSDDSTAAAVKAIVEKSGKGAFGAVEVDGDTAKEIAVMAGGKGKGKKKDN